MNCNLNKYKKLNYYFEKKKDNYFYHSMFKFLELEDDVPYWNTNENNFIILCLLFTKFYHSN